MRILRRPLFAIALAALGICFIAGIIVFSRIRPADAFQGETPTPAPTVSAQTPPARPPSAQPTASSPAAARAAVLSVRATGNLASANQATLAFQAAGRIKEIKVKQGERVKAGTILALLDTSSLDAQVASAEANLAKVKAGPASDDVLIAKVAVDRAKAAVDQAQAAYDRIGGSSNPGISASSQGLALQQATFSYQEALARFNLAVNHPTQQELTAAQATLEAAKIAAANARLIAPFDGTVVWIGVRVGESAAVGTGALAVADLSRMQLVLNVDEVSVGSIQVGQPATITLDALPGKQVRGRVSSVALFGISSGSLVTIPVTIDLESTTLLIYPGLSGTAEIQGATP